MKNKFLITIGIIVAALAIYSLQNQKLKAERQASDMEDDLVYCWRDKLEQYHFLMHTTFSHREDIDDWMDSLDVSYRLVSHFMVSGQMPKSDKQFLKALIEVQLPAALRVTKEEVFQRADIQSFDDLFTGSKWECVRKLDKVLNPNFMSSCNSISYKNDIWEKEQPRKHKPGDTITFMIRLVENYALGCGQVEFVPTNNLTIVDAYLAELCVVIPKTHPPKKHYIVPYRLYSYKTKDTLAHSISVLVH